MVASTVLVVEGLKYGLLLVIVLVESPKGKRSSDDEALGLG